MQGIEEQREKLERGIERIERLRVNAPQDQQEQIDYAIRQMEKVLADLPRYFDERGVLNTMLRAAPLDGKKWIGTLAEKIVGRVAQ